MAPVVPVAMIVVICCHDSCSGTCQQDSGTYCHDSGTRCYGSGTCRQDSGAGCHDGGNSGGDSWLPG